MSARHTKTAQRTVRRAEPYPDAIRSRAVPAPTLALRTTGAPAAATRAQAAGRSGRCRCGPEVASSSSRLTVAIGPVARWSVS